ncbi:MAG: hypothetical protein DWQ07_21895 [Chloroflexi bacterium]|nr:MAG: hypothetical protein DWQ07_21895 [Chloroflexota bacterium]MBL1196393.1 hypothetical protein [Chloroflexota bacterium]NOH13688.1 hypothetical protein [Chloroflexota bacterium]
MQETIRQKRSLIFCRIGASLISIFFIISTVFAWLNELSILIVLSLIMALFTSGLFVYYLRMKPEDIKLSSSQIYEEHELLQLEPYHPKTDSKNIEFKRHIWYYISTIIIILILVFVDVLFFMVGLLPGLVLLPLPILGLYAIFFSPSHLSTTKNHIQIGYLLYSKELHRDQVKQILLIHGARQSVGSDRVVIQLMNDKNLIFSRFNVSPPQLYKYLESWWKETDQN